MEANSVKILVIDDNIDNLTTIKAVINELFPQATVFTGTYFQFFRFSNGLLKYYKLM